MRCRWFQFSLRTAMVMMLIAAVGIGVWVRWPYVRAENVLDNAQGSKDFAEWPAVRAALVHDVSFRNYTAEVDHPFYVRRLREGDMYYVAVLKMGADDECWLVYLDTKTGLPTGKIYRAEH